jgi:predicted ATPase
MTTLPSPPLGRYESALLVERAKGKILPSAGDGRNSGARTDGVPLFIEELTKKYSKLEYCAKTIKATNSTADTLHGSLLARLDRLNPGGHALVGAAAEKILMTGLPTRWRRASRKVSTRSGS